MFQKEGNVCRSSVSTERRKGDYLLLKMLAGLNRPVIDSTCAVVLEELL
jgi:hypothetical protein